MVRNCKTAFSFTYFGCLCDFSRSLNGAYNNISSENPGSVAPVNNGRNSALNLPEMLQGLEDSCPTSVRKGLKGGKSRTPGSEESITKDSERSFTTFWRKLLLSSEKIYSTSRYFHLFEDPRPATSGRWQTDRPACVGLACPRGPLQVALNLPRLLSTFEYEETE